VSLLQILDQALICKDALSAKSECPHKGNEIGEVLRSGNQSEQLAEEKQTDQEMDTDEESEPESFSDSDSKVGEGTVCQ